MNALILPGLDLIAITVLTFALYLPRHRRGELVPAFLGVNVGVLAVSMALTSSAATVGLGLGLFGVLSIIRLRSSELSQREIAYYFAALALGLLGGIGLASAALGAALMALVLLALAVGDHPRVSGSQAGPTQQVVVLDHAVADPHELRARLEGLLGAQVLSSRTLRLDLVNDSTQVEVTTAPVRAQAMTTAASPGTGMTHTPASAAVTEAGAVAR